MRSRIILALIGATALGASSAARVHADSLSIGFESPTYTTGSIDGQDGWGGQNPPGIAVNGSIDQGVTGPAAHTGTQSYRESSSFTSGSFGDQVFSPSLTDRAGEPGSVDGGFAGGTLQPRFTSTFWFKSATGAVQDNHVVISADRGDGARMSWIQISDNMADPGATCANSPYGPCTTDADCSGFTCLPDGRSGLSVSFNDYRAPANLLDCGGEEDAENKCFVFRPLATNLSRSAWHRVDFEIEFYDGKANDVLRVSVDGTPVFRGTTWEDYFPNNQGFDFPTDPPPVDSLLFRVGGPQEGNAGEGFLFDDVAYASTACQAATRYVTTGGDDTFNDCRDVGSPCKTVQHGVDVACVGDTVQVAAGTFPEQVTIPKSVTVLGAGAASTFIKPVSVSPNTTSLSSGNPIAAIILVDGASGVTLKNLTVDGSAAAFASCSPGYMGVYYRNGSGTIDTLHVAHIVLPTATGCQSVVGVFVQSGGSGSSTVNLKTSTIDDYGKNGVTCNEVGTTCTITGNTVTGRGPVGSGDAAQNGIQMGFGAVGSIVGNTVTGNYYTPKTVCASGVLVFSDGVNVQGNTINGNLCDLDAETSNSTIDGNIIDPALDFPFSIIGDNNVVSLNVVRGSSGVGVYNDGKGNSYSCNRISNNNGGFFFDNFSGPGTPNSVHNNSITGNGVGIDATAIGAPPINATGNWFGCPAGPGNPGCDSVTGSVNASGPLPAPPPCVSCSSNADCSDTLVCNGTEVCNAGTCMAGTPPVCGLGPADPQCNVASCVEPSGCTVVQDPNGSSCSIPPSCSVPDTCQAGACTSGPGGGDSDADTICDADDNCPTAANTNQADLDNDGQGDVCDTDEGPLNPTFVKLKRANSAVKPTGLVVVKADFVAAAPDPFGAASEVTVQVNTAGLPTNFSMFHTWSSAECPIRTGRVTCASADNRFKAKFKAFKAAPEQWRAVVKFRKQAIDPMQIFQGPANVRLSYGPTPPAVGSIDHVGAVSDCRASTSGLLCRQF